jgi:serine/threonine protein phosphatase PrpC
MADAVARCDKEFLEIAADAELADGTTATVVAVTAGGVVVVGNVGDSEAVLARAAGATAAAGDSAVERLPAPDSGLEVLPLSAVHNVAQNEDEGKRVVAAGGNIFHNRLGHPCLNPAYFSIAVSRAIGDLMFKADSYTDGKPSGLTADPEFRSVALGEGDRFLLIACDGLWSVIPHGRAVDIAAKALADLGDKDLDAVCKVVADTAFDEGSTDNITVMIVLLTPE